MLTNQEKRIKPGEAQKDKMTERFFEELNILLSLKLYSTDLSPFYRKGSMVHFFIPLA